MNVNNSGDLLDKYKLLGAIINAKWSTSLDHKIAWAIIENYWKKHGNSRASLRYLVNATGAKHNSSVIGSLKRIVASGAIEIARLGKGTRPTEYSLNFEFIPKKPSGGPETTADSGGLQTTSEVAQRPPLDPSSGGPETTESHSPCMPTGMLTGVSSEESPAAPPAPPAGGLKPAAAESAVAPKKAGGPFDELWTAWGRKEKRADARDAYAKLAPDATLHTRLVESAEIWTANYAAIGAAKKYQKHLHNWLRGECWLEDLPAAYENFREAAVSRKKDRGASRKADDGQVGKSGLTSGTPQGRHAVEIIGSDVIGGGVIGGDATMSFRFRIHGGMNADREFGHSFVVASDDEDTATEGQEIFKQLRVATGIIAPEDTDDFHGAMLCAVVGRGGKITYEAQH